jgi:hypothetical protein
MAKAVVPCDAFRDRYPTDGDAMAARLHALALDFLHETATDKKKPVNGSA